MFTKSKLQYFPNILGVEKSIKGHKHQGKGELHRVFLVYFLLSNSFVLPPHGRLNLFGWFFCNSPLSYEILFNKSFDF